MENKTEEDEVEDEDEILGHGDDEVVGLMGKLKNARLKEIEKELTEEQLKSEKE